MLGYLPTLYTPFDIVVSLFKKATEFRQKSKLSTYGKAHLSDPLVTLQTESPNSPQRIGLNNQDCRSVCLKTSYQHCQQLLHLTATLINTSDENHPLLTEADQFVSFTWSPYSSYTHTTWMFQPLKPAFIFLTCHSIPCLLFPPCPLTYHMNKPQVF